MRNRQRAVHLSLVVLLSIASLVVWTGTAAAAPAAAGRTSSANTGISPLDLNAASAEALVAVPGIGKTLARRIVEFRDKNGPFRRVEDLMKVKGIGEKSFQKLRPYFTVRSH